MTYCEKISEEELDALRQRMASNNYDLDTGAEEQMALTERLRWEGDFMKKTMLEQGHGKDIHELVWSE